MPSFAGNFFPPDFKAFPFKEGDLLASKHDDGKYSINKVLKVDKIIVKKGGSILIQNQKFEAPEDDYLLIISCSYGKSEFNSLEEAKKAAESGKWKIEYGHIPNRAPGATSGQILIGHKPVSENELLGYKQWKAAFDKGEAGVF